MALAAENTFAPTKEPLYENMGFDTLYMTALDDNDPAMWTYYEMMLMKDLGLYNGPLMEETLYRRLVDKAGMAALNGD